MKFVRVLFILLILFVGCESLENVKEQLGFKKQKKIVQKTINPHPIKSMIVVEYVFAFGKAFQQQKPIRDFKFDAIGKKITKTQLPSPNQYISTEAISTLIVYDTIKKNTGIKWTVKHYGNYNISQETWDGNKKEYLSNGHEIQLGNDKTKNKTTTYWKNNYDKYGNIIEEIEYFSSKKIKTKRTHKYDENGTKTLSQEYTVNGAHIIEYDKYGNELVETWYDLLNEPKKQWKYIYEYY